MSELISIFEIPCCSTDLTYEVSTTYEKSDWILRFAFDREGKGFRSGIRFNSVMAYKYLNAFHCTAWHIDAYDTVVEVSDSDWVRSAYAAMDENQRKNLQKLRHFMIFFDDGGAYEALAQSVDLLTE